MNIHTLKLGPLHTNCYILSDKQTKEAIIIDPADEVEKIIDFIKKNSLKSKAIIVTHFHFDHIGALEETEDNFGIRVSVLKEGDKVKLGEASLKIIETPGHTNDGISIVCEKEKAIFTGDTLFKNAIGRTDLPTGDYEEIKKSLARIMKYPDDFKVYPGHGDNSTIGEEKEHNPYLSNK